MTVVAVLHPLILLPDTRFGTPAGIAALLLSTAVLAISSAAVFPFEMDTVVGLSGGRLVGTHYGFYSTIVGVGILAGNVATGALMQAASQHSLGVLVWTALTGIGLLCTAALHTLARNGHLQKPTWQRRTATNSPARKRGPDEQKPHDTDWRNSCSHPRTAPPESSPRPCNSYGAKPALSRSSPPPRRRPVIAGQCTLHRDDSTTRCSVMAHPPAVQTDPGADNP